MKLLYGVFYLSIYFITFITILLYITLVYNRQNIIDNWPLYRCNPIVIPFASFFGKDPSENLQGCLFTSTEGFFGILIQPFQMIMKIFVKILDDLFNQLNVLRVFLEPVREFIRFSSDMVYQKVEGVMNVVIYSFLKINNIMKRVFANFRLAVYSLEASQMAINSTWNGPIGGLIRTWSPVVDFFCFAKGTDINGIPIENIEIGGNILGTLVFKAPKQLYNYKGILVSGNHFVFHNGYWTMVKNTGAKLVPYSGETLHSLITADHLIRFSGILWADYEETDRLYKVQKRLSLKNLGIQQPNEMIEEPNLVLDDTKIIMNNGSMEKISDLEIGDVLFPENAVIGIVKMRAKIHHQEGLGIANILFKSSEWVLENPDDTNISEAIHYNLITSKGYFVTEKVIVRDYIEIDRIDLYSELSNMTQCVL